ncbi:uncharacterized protein BDV17DRAFT_293149 [Aspergillus undulatus]|uniref:uncharacterized protein n=1 Tax=Aspergillus undulatus TaxID=1810928 RepID=UPI003CCDE3E4
MSKLLDRIKDAMANRKSKSKHPSRGSDSSVYEADNIGVGGRSDYTPYRSEDYGSRFESYGIKSRPGTYGYGNYGSNTRLETVPYGNDYGSHSTGRVHSPTANGYSRPSYTRIYSHPNAGSGQGFDGDVGNSSNRGLRYEYGGSYRVQL